MAKMYGIFRIGKDAELRRTPAGKAVVNLSLAYSFGRAGDDGKKPTQWIEASLWDKQAEALAQYLLKGNQIGATISDIHIETYEGQNGTGSKLVGRIDDVELTDRKDGAQKAPSAAPKPAAKPAGSGFEDMPDDIPF